MQHGRQQKLSSGVVNFITDLSPLKTEGQGCKVGKEKGLVCLGRIGESSALLWWELKCRREWRKSRFRFSSSGFGGGLEECSSVKKLCNLLTSCKSSGLHRSFKIPQFSGCGCLH